MAVTSNTIYLQAYNIYTWLTAYAEEFLLASDAREQIEQNIYLEDHKIDSLNTSNDALRDNFGTLAQVKRPATWDRDQFKTLLDTIFQAWDESTSVKAFNLVSNAFVGQDALLVQYYKRRNFPLGTSGKVRAYPGGTLGYQWDNMTYWLYNRYYRLTAGTALAPANDLGMYVYVDGTLSGVDSRQLQILTSDVEPVSSTKDRTEIILVADIETDTDGTITGTKGAKYIHTNYFPLELVEVLTDGTDTTSQASLLSNSDVLDLGYTQMPSSYVQVTYKYRYEIDVLGCIETDSTKITSITGCRRLGDSGRGHTKYSKAFGGEVYISNSANLDSETKGQIYDLLHLMKPAHTMFYLLFQGGSAGYTYYGKI